MRNTKSPQRIPLEEQIVVKEKEKYMLGNYPYCVKGGAGRKDEIDNRKRHVCYFDNYCLVAVL
jgi:hypothetical protein